MHYRSCGCKVSCSNQVAIGVWHSVNLKYPSTLPLPPGYEHLHCVYSHCIYTQQTENCAINNFIVVDKCFNKYSLKLLL